MRNIKNLMKVASVVGDDEKILMDLYKDLGEYLGITSDKSECNPKLAVIGRKFRYSTDAEQVLKELGYKKIDAFNYADLQNGIYVVIESEGSGWVICENK